MVSVACAIISGQGLLYEPVMASGLALCPKLFRERHRSRRADQLAVVQKQRMYLSSDACSCFGKFARYIPDGKCR